jgi:hypothetical protein
MIWHGRRARPPRAMEIALANLERQDRLEITAVGRVPFGCRVGFHLRAPAVRDPKVREPRNMVFCRRCGALLEYSIAGPDIAAAFEKGVNQGQAALRADKINRAFEGSRLAPKELREPGGSPGQDDGA